VQCAETNIYILRQKSQTTTNFIVTMKISGTITVKCFPHKFLKFL